MTQKIRTPVITEDVMNWIEGVFDVPQRASDSAEVLRWKAAQRDVVLKVKAVHEEQKTGGRAKKGSKAEAMNFKLRPPE